MRVINHVNGLGSDSATASILRRIEVLGYAVAKA